MEFCYYCGEIANKQQNGKWVCKKHTKLFDLSKEKQYYVWFEAVPVKAVSEDEAIEKAKEEIKKNPILSDIQKYE